MTLDELARLQAAFGSQLSARQPSLAPLSPWLDADPDTTRRFLCCAETVRHHHERSLALIFPVLKALVGDVFFRELAQEYGAANPSRAGDLARFGVHLPEFIATLPVADAYPYFSDTARLEWMLHLAHGAHDGNSLSVRDVRAVEPSELESWPLCLHPSVGLYVSRWSTVSIWFAHTQPLTHALPASIHQPMRAIVYRSGWSPTVREISETEWTALAALAEITTLGHALLVAGERHERLGAKAQAFDPGALLSRWLTDRLLVRA